MLVRMRRKGNPPTLLVGMQAGLTTLENSILRKNNFFIKKLKIELPYDPAIALLAIYPKDTNAVIQRVTCTPIFIAAMSTIANYGKSPRVHRLMNG